MGEEKKGFWSRLVSGLSKTRDNIVSGIDSIFSGFSSIDDDFYEEIEEILIMGDIGVNATEAIIENLKEKVKENKIKDPAECKELLINSIKEQMDVGETAYRFENEKSVVLVIGVNGVGKTTSVGKLAGKLKDQGKKVVLAAADTFRAAAGDQLLEWANRAGVEMIGGQEGADPASIVYDAVAAAKARNADVLLCDTAGRLHNKKNLMEELKKINRILEKEYPGAIPRNSCRIRCNDRSERTCTGETIFRSGRDHRYHSNKDGRNGKRRYCGCNPLRTWNSGQIYRCRRDHRGFTEV